MECLNTGLSNYVFISMRGESTVSKSRVDGEDDKTRLCGVETDGGLYPGMCLSR